MSSYIKKSLDRLNNFTYATTWFYINLNWFSSWFFVLPLFLNIRNTYNYRDNFTTFYCILVPSLLRHAHFKYVSKYISFFEKWLVISAVLSIFTRRVNYILTNDTISVINYYDIGIFGSVFYNSYIYFVANLSYSRYGVIWHSTIHLAGAIGLVCGILAY